MAALMQGHDWSATPLGPSTGWAAPLRTLVAVLLGAHQPMFLLWGPTRVLLYNDACIRILAGKHPAALGRPVLDVWSEIREDLAPVLDAACAGKAIHRTPLTPLLHRKGYPEETHVDFSCTPVRDEAGAVAGLFCPCTETTLAVLAERRLAAEGDRLRDLFRQAPGFCYVWRGPEHVYEMANDAYFQLVGHRDIIGKPAREALPEIRGQGFFELADRAYASGEPYVGRGVPAKIRRSPGAPLEQRFVTFVFQPIRDADGRVNGLFVQGSDVTEEKRAEQALRDLNVTLERRVAEHTADRDRMWRLSTDVMLVARFDATITAVNPAWARLLDWTEAELVGRSFLDWVHPDDRDATIAEASRLASGLTTASFENRYRHRDGSYRWISWIAVPDEHCIHAAGRDVTAQKEREAALRQAEEQLRQAQKMEAVGQLTGGVAHDFNNLLQAMSGCLTMIGRRTVEPKVRPLLEAGQQAVERGAKLVKQLMAFARREGLRPEPIDVRDRVLAMSGLLERVLRADIRLVTRFAPGLWAVEADPTQFELALLNLVVNARDAMPAAGTLTVEAVNATLLSGDPSGLEGEFLRLEVADTGCGMAPEVQAKAFDPFFTTKAMGKGSGLGLAQVYGLARQAGGSAWIESEPGRGTAVVLLLRRSIVAPGRPAGDMAGDTAAPSAGPAPLPGRGGRLLLVEDDPVVASTVAAALEDIGYDVVQAATADEALPLLTSDGGIDLLFSDVVMPGRLSGVDLVREARRLRPDLPVVLATGYSEKVAQATGVRVLAKPYRIDELARVLESVSREPPRTGGDPG